MVGTISKVTVNVMERPKGLFDLPYSYESFVAKQKRNDGENEYGDKVMYIKRHVPIVPMSNELIEHLVVGGEIPDELVDLMGDVYEPPVFVGVSDNEVIVMDTGYTDRVVRAGRVTIEVENEIMEKVCLVPRKSLTTENIKEVKKSLYEESSFYGMTRLEREKKKYVLDVIDSFRLETLEQLKYYYVEIVGGKYVDVVECKEKDEVIDKIRNVISEDKGYYCDLAYHFFVKHNYGKLNVREVVDWMERRKVDDPILN